ncbi:hypothetical protein RND81_05G069400 [Saponaria officinalis]|uniref:Agenet domain-containing protein n=1 Tax=Saponaria officinalis TaxID=3572 RepID=A0AAW1KVH9_SAPOF
MSEQPPLLFQVGQLVEARSFIQGYRGAWFRCEIKDVARDQGQIRYHVRYYDYEADGLQWLNLHEVPMISKDSKEAKRELMLRPQFPPIYRESELPDTDTILDVALVVDGCWSVGDMVDWLEEGCFWCGTITKILGDDTAEIKLPDEPVGEGLLYVGSYKDLRPSLNWSPDFGWSFPESQHGHSHARLIQPLKQGVRLCRSDPLTSSWTVVLASPAQLPKSLVKGSQGTKNTKARSRLMRCKNTLNRGKDIPGEDGGQTHEGSTGSNTGGSAVQEPSAEIPVATFAEKKDPENVPAKKVTANEPIRRNSTSCDIESAIAGLEELVCKLKWLKHILKFGRPLTSQDDKWEYHEHPTVSKPK